MRRARRALWAGAAVLLAAALASADETTHGKVPRGNPPQADPARELMRLRAEGLANYEGGVTLKNALALFEAALKRQPESAVELFNLATTERKVNRLDDAREHLKKALAADPKLPQAAYTLGVVEKAAGHAEAALALFEKARALAPTEPSVYYQLSSVYRALGKDDASLQALTRVLELDPHHSGALYQMYQYHHRMGNEARAEEVFREFSRVKRAAGASRREVNYDEGRLTLPIAASPYDAANRPEHESFKPRFDVTPIALPVRGVALDWRDADGDSREDLVIASSGGRFWVLPNRGGGELGPPRELTAAAQRETSSLVVESFVAKGGPGAVAGGPQGLAYAPLDLARGSLDWKPLSEGEDTPLLVFDADHDGDLDVLAEKGRTLWVNRGNGEFAPDPQFFSEDVKKLLARSSAVVSAAFANGDGVDLLLWNRAGERRLLLDGQGGRYDPAGTHPPDLQGLGWVGAADMDNDGLVDLVTISRDRLRVELNRGGLRFEESFDADLGGEGGTAAIGDFDNDGLKDVMTLRPGAAPDLWLNQGGGKFERVAVRGASVPPLRSRPLAVDVAGDGRLDLLLLTESGECLRLRNSSTGIGNWMELRLQGVRSAPSGDLARIETRIGPHYQAVEADGRTVHLGLGNEKYVEVLRITWPNGFVENKFKVDAGNTWTFKESERISGSCPTVFAWNGKRFWNVTDAFISGPMGVPMAKGRYFPVNHEEYLKLSADELRSDRGHYRIRITEELREVDYFDSVRLLAVDHPAEVAIYPNARLGPFPFPPFHVFGISAPRPPLSARDTSGRDVLDLVRAVDGRYTDDVVRIPYAGFAEPHWIEFELPPDAAASPHLRLLLNGWFYYFESTSLISASQRPDLRTAWPEIQAEVGGQWRTVEVAGVPPGKHKTIVLDLAGKLPPGTTRLRLYSNVAIYWDAILFDAAEPRDDDHTLAEVPLERAWLEFRGFSSRVEPPAPSIPERFDYDPVSYGAPWNPLRGKYTRYGDVKPLLEKRDSRLAVFGSGDELVLDFDARRLAPPRAGWVRDYLLHLDGYVKDGDRYTAYAGQVEPLPFAGMREFPFAASEGDPTVFQDPEYRAYLRDYQSRNPLRFVGPPLTAGPGDLGQDFLTAR